jgi:hypothetical protein
MRKLIIATAAFTFLSSAYLSSAFLSSTAFAQGRGHGGTRGEERRHVQGQDEQDNSQESEEIQQDEERRRHEAIGAANAFQKGRLRAAFFIGHCGSRRNHCAS